MLLPQQSVRPTSLLPAEILRQQNQGSASSLSNVDSHNGWTNLGSGFARIRRVRMKDSSSCRYRGTVSSLGIQCRAQRQVGKQLVYQAAPDRVFGSELIRLSVAG